MTTRITIRSRWLRTNHFKWACTVQSRASLALADAGSAVPLRGPTE